MRSLLSRGLRLKVRDYHRNNDMRSTVLEDGVLVVVNTIPKALCAKDILCVISNRDALVSREPISLRKVRMRSRIALKRAAEFESDNKWHYRYVLPYNNGN